MILISCNLTEFISSKNFLVESLRFSVYSIFLSANSDSLTSLPIWVPFICFSCLITVARTSSILLEKKNGRSGYPCLISVLTRQIFTIEYYVSCEFNSMAFIMLNYVPSIPILLAIYIMNKYWILSKIFFISWDERDFYPSHFNAVYYTDDFHVLNKTCVCRINPTWLWWMVVLMYFWIWISLNFVDHKQNKKANY